MNLDEVQSTIKALLDAAPILARITPVVLQEDTTDLTEKIDGLLSEKGACIIVGDVGGGESEQSSPGGVTKSLVHIPVYILSRPPV